MTKRADVCKVDAELVDPVVELEVVGIGVDERFGLEDRLRLLDEPQRRSQFDHVLQVVPTYLAPRTRTHTFTWPPQTQCPCTMLRRHKHARAHRTRSSTARNEELARLLVVARKADGRSAEQPLNKQGSKSRRRGPRRSRRRPAQRPELVKAAGRRRGTWETSKRTVAGSIPAGGAQSSRSGSVCASYDSRPIDALNGGL